MVFKAATITMLALLCAMQAFSLLVQRGIDLRQVDMLAEQAGRRAVLGYINCKVTPKEDRKRGVVGCIKGHDF